jgi:hypothetical protein
MAICGLQIKAMAETSERRVKRQLTGFKRADSMRTGRAEQGGAFRD